MIKVIGKKEYVINTNPKVCIRCKGLGQIQLMSNSGISESKCPHCNISRKA